MTSRTATQCYKSPVRHSTPNMPRKLNVSRGSKSKSLPTSPLLRLRADHGWSMLRLAAIADVQISIIRAIERGDTKTYLNTKIKYILQLAVALGCAPSDILPFLNRRPKGSSFVVGADVLAPKEE